MGYFWSIIGLALLGAVSNWFLRGGGWESAFPEFYKKNQKMISGDIPNALIYGGMAWLISDSVAVGLCAVLGMFAGAAPGWGEYISAMKGDHPEETRLWGVGMMTLRGIVWGAILAQSVLVPSVLHMGRPPWSFCWVSVMAGSTLGVLYFLMIKWFEKNNSNRIFNHWTMGEQLFGAVLWPSLILLLP